MASIQRQFTKLTVKGGGNDAKIQVVLDDFDIADKTIAQLVDSLKQWRSSWANILNSSVGIAKEFEGTLTHFSLSRILSDRCRIV